MPPLIGITAHQKPVEEVGHQVLHHVVNSAYVKAVRKAGGVPVLLPMVDPADAPALLERVDGLVVTGGDDVDPASYGEHPAPETGPTDPARDTLDLALCRLAVEWNSPTLAICRGAQVLNVALGGGLVQHVDDHFHLDRFNASVHPVEVDADSTLARWLGRTGAEVNSLHHQAAGRLAPAVRVVARAPDGTPEGLEVEGSDRVVAVQWHPELLRHRQEQVALFAGLVQLAAGVPT